jgi:GT2 family glycosyltransferase
LPQIDLLIVIVNYRTPELTVDCLQSLAQQRPSLRYAMQTIVVDNASNDGSAATLQTTIDRAGWGAWCGLWSSDRNLGFAGGNNLAVRHGPASRYVLLLNSDTRVHEQCLNYCLDQMAKDTDLGAMSCRLVQPDGAVQTQARRFPAPWREALNTLGLPWRWPKQFGWACNEDLSWDRAHEAHDVDWLGGAFLLLRRAALEQVGLLDEGFFFYGEDIELCHRLARAGWKRRYDPAVAITHYGGASSQATPIHARAAYWTARYQVQQRCYGRGWAFALRHLETSVWALRRVKARLSPKADREAKHRADQVWHHLRQARSG